MRYRLVDPNEGQTIDLADGATPSDLRYMLHFVRVSLDPKFWDAWRVVSYEQDGEETWLEPRAIVDAS